MSGVACHWRHLHQVLFYHTLLISHASRRLTPPKASVKGCAVTGTVFYSVEQTFALLHSNCLIEIQRRDKWIIMIAPHWVIAVEIPSTPGKRTFTYAWGSPWAIFGAGPTTSEWVAVAVGRRAGA